MPRFRYVRLTPDELATGRPLAFGDEVELDADAVEQNARLAPWLLALPDEPAPTRKSAPTPTPETEESVQ